ncbi:MAG: thymidine kinase [Myxococcales bacterium]|nr:thymidine kinase [Myxococcales bacterium]|tara:strand:- start:1070 stop:1810 length:741 start_codon:yes stop_codon:yes gene_type:complete
MAKLYFYYSAMNAGKSTTLLQSDYNYRERGMRTLLFCPRLDDRYGHGVISSRIGLQANANLFDKESDFFAVIREANRRCAVNCVLVDEAQFLAPEQVLQLTMVCDELNIPVLCYGLRTDFRGEPFEGSKYLLCWAEEIVEIKTVCFSGKKATMNARVDINGNQIIEGEQVDIGHHYISLSRKEFGLVNVSPIGYRPVRDGSEGQIVYGEPSQTVGDKPNTMPPEKPAIDALADAESALLGLSTGRA